jgi:adenylosuccinate synthase
VRIEAVYETLPGGSPDDRDPPLGRPARRGARYLARLGEIIGTDVALVSVGPDRAEHRASEACSRSDSNFSQIAARFRAG